MEISKSSASNMQILPKSKIENSDKVGDRQTDGSSKMREVAEEFESLFVDLVLQSMRKSVMKSKFIDGGNAENMYQSMLDTEYSKLISTQDQTGLATMIEKQLRSYQNQKPSKLKMDVDYPNAIKAYNAQKNAADIKSSIYLKK